MKVLSFLTAFLLTLPNSLPARQATSSPPANSTQATTLLARSLSALTGSATLNDVTLSGTARRIAGSDDESGTVVVKLLASTGNRIDLNLSSGTRSEVRNTSTLPSSGAWNGPDGVSHSIADHNLVADPAWFPAFTLANFSAPQWVVTYVGPETKNGISVIHLSASQLFPALSVNGAAIMQHLSQTQIFLDATTLLPVAIAFTMHPDNNSSLDILVEMDFSDYRKVNGVQIPFHVQKLLNNGLVLDLLFQTAILNTGLSASQFAVQ